MARAKTGTGKTMAFLIPAIEALCRSAAAAAQHSTALTPLGQPAPGLPSCLPDTRLPEGVP